MKLRIFISTLLLACVAITAWLICRRTSQNVLTAASAFPPRSHLLLQSANNPPANPTTIISSPSSQPAVRLPVGTSKPIPTASGHPTTAHPVVVSGPLPHLPAPPPQAVDSQTEIEFHKVNRMLKDFRNLTGENPVGTNAEIMKTLMGDNPQHARLGPPEGMNLNGNGELVDQWGTPYFFHQVSSSEMEIRSAGPDRKMWTDDDIVAK